jgi:hypothetical protein
MYDLRIMHRGGPNQSDAERPLVVYLTISRIRYRDTLKPLEKCHSPTHSPRGLAFSQPSRNRFSLLVNPNVNLSIELYYCV